MAIPLSDPFSGSNTTIEVYNASWVEVADTGPGCEINVGAAMANAAASADGIKIVRWDPNTDDFNANQEAELDLDTGGLPWADYVGVGVRVQDDGDGYFALARDADSAVLIVKRDGGSNTTLATSSNDVIADGDVLKIDVDGTTITAYVNGSSVVSTTDSTFADGQPGFYVTCHAAYAQTYLAAFAADNLAAASGDIAASADVTFTATATLYNPTTELDLTSGDITWRVRFIGDRQRGTFAMGDHWIEGPVDVISITPASTTYGGGLVNGSMVDPDPMDLDGSNRPNQGIDQRDPYSTYVASLDVAPEIGSGTPLTITPSSGSYKSLVSSKYSAVTSTSFVEAMSVLTVCHSDFLPASGDFRPYTGPTKDTEYRNVDEISPAALGSMSLGLSAGVVSGIEDDVARFLGIQWDSWVHGDFMPLDNSDAYYRDRNRQLSEAMLLANSDQKTDAVVRGIVQRAIDVKGAYDEGSSMGSPAGHGSGYAWYVWFAGVVLGEPTWLTFHASKPDDIPEITQTFYAEAGVTPNYNASHELIGTYSFSGPEWYNALTAGGADRQEDWEANPYRRCCSTKEWIGLALSMRLMGVSDDIAHGALFDYVERYVTKERADYTELNQLLSSSLVMDAYDTYWTSTDDIAAAATWSFTGSGTLEVPESDNIAADAAFSFVASAAISDTGASDIAAAVAWSFASYMAIVMDLSHPPIGAILLGGRSRRESSRTRTRSRRTR